MTWKPAHSTVLPQAKFLAKSMVLRNIHVRENDGVRDFDAHVSFARRHQDTTLHVPPSISHGGDLGRSIAFAQLISTWAHTSPKGHIRTNLPVDSPEAYESFVSRVHGLAAAHWAHKVTARDDRTDLQKDLLSAAKPRIVAMSRRHFADVAKGQLTELIFVNYAHRQFHSAVYRHQPTNADLKDPQRHGSLIVSSREMNTLVFHALEAQNLPRSDFQLLAPLLESPRLPLGHLLHEIFRNTAEHAYLEEGQIPAKGIRCLLIAHRISQPHSLQTRALVSVDHPRLHTYFESLRDRAGSGNRNLVHLLELSVLDAGPGFAHTIRHTLSPTTSDSDCVKQCFVDHKSSKPGPNSGLGLGRVLSHVNSLGGFIRFRTSTTEAVYTSSTANASHPVPHVASDLPEVRGTALTIVIPLGINVGRKQTQVTSV